MVDLESFHAHRAAIVYNPVARALSRRLHLLQRITENLASQGIQAKLVATTAPGSAAGQVRRELQSGCDLIIAAGGDGTINEVAEGMLNTQVPLAILPGGTANVLARELKMPMNMERAAADLSALQPCRLSVGSLRKNAQPARCFLCMAGAGLDAEIVLRLNLDLKALGGKLAYYVAGFSQVLRPIYEFSVVVDGNAYKASFALVSRVRNYGGDLAIARGASLLRDEFEIVLFQGTVSARYLGYLAAVAIGQVHRVKGCTVLHGRSVTFRAPESRDIYLQIDGELAGTLPASVEVMPDALTLLVPSAYLTRERRFASAPAFA